MKRAILYVAAGLAALVVVAGIGATAAYVVMTNMGPVQTVTVVRDGYASTLDLSKGATVHLKEFVTNLADTDRPRYIKVSFELVAADEKDAKRLADNMPLIRDLILSTLNGHTSTELAGEAGWTALQKEIIERVNSRLGGQYVRKVLRTDYVIQY